MKTFHCSYYDCKYDQEGIFLEKICPDRECIYCPKRPDKHPDDCVCKSEEDEWKP